ncbi:copper chaperone NosL [Arenibacter nanhaiticus]|uniref:Copper chaperone NosL n=1 Tax=Arenibacter nanhaiticus TaxID=558155 RepID=A0A1M6GYY8_9FLAO|nr:nitrous oxide reductase accessory protein NosL [Arenibacter nanhaiticus]SHJ15126.1 copper chaperone NosL [Arenibacter nanhaiticus]
MKPCYFILSAVLLMLTSCKIAPQPIDYGSDGCYFCSMTIVDRQHAAQIVTKKGKAFKFDAIECMLNHLKEIDQKEVALFLVNDYGKPGELIDARIGHFLISKEISSPMGANLSAFSRAGESKDHIKAYDGVWYSWKELLQYFKSM